MSTPTKKERHAVYKKALKLFGVGRAGLCLVIAEADGKWAKDWWDVNRFYPEFAAQYDPDKEKGYYGLSHQAWSILTQAQADMVRRKALRRFIRITKPAKRKSRS